jgi:hypothetical protein
MLATSYLRRLRVVADTAAPLGATDALSGTRFGPLGERLRR